MSSGYEQFQDPPSQDLLQRISEAARELREQDRKIEEEEARLQEMKKRRQHISEKRIPDLMEEAGFERFTTSDGIEVDVKEHIRASIPKDRAGQAFRWLEEQGHGELIKRGFSIRFNREQQEAAERFEQMVQEQYDGFDVKQERTVHPQTLQAFIREQLEAGVDIPLSLFGAIKQRIARVRVK